MKIKQLIDLGLNGFNSNMTLFFFIDLIPIAERFSFKLWDKIL
jgi:hypothetical protein